jgi:dTDP-glucose 4,6-dehydratase
VRIAVTGGAGFIGSNFVAYLCEKHPDWHIVNIDKLTYAANPLTLEFLASFPNNTFFQYDIAEAKELDDLVAKCDAVINFAAETHVDRAMMNAEEFVRTDILGTFHLLESVRRKKISRYIQISTDEVYGSVESGSAVESSPLDPTNPYAVSKASADLFVLSYIKCYGISANIIRFSNNYGPFQHPEKFMPLALTNAIEDRPIPVYGDGTQSREWLFVTDTCRAIELILQRGVEGEIYNVSSGQEEKNIEVARKILGFLGKPESLISYVPDRVAHDRRYSLSSEKIAALGFSPEYTFTKGFEETAAWYLSNSRWWKEIKEGKSFQAYYSSRYGAL